MQRPILTVSEVNRYIKDILSNNIILSNVLICGEISNFKNHYSGHMYFTLKDETSAIKCVMFKYANDGLKFEPQDGMKVIAAGKVSVYERDGNYQIYIDDMQPDGVGALHMAFEQLKSKLELEGLFEQERKKQMPVLPKSIGIVTSPTGAAIRDILNILGRRYSNVKVLIRPVLVQGEGAKEQISNAIEDFNRLKNVDVIIIGRGGGSIEELWAFNEEIVARSIANSQIPIISAVGHETDFTIADFVADLRAPTPSAAAELVVPNRIDIETALNSLCSRLNYAIENILDKNRSSFDKMKIAIYSNRPIDKVYQYRISTDMLNRNLQKETKYIVNNKDAKLREVIGRLCSLNPLEVLKRGYCVSSASNKIVRSVNEVEVGDELNIQYIDGMIKCKVNIK